MNALRRKVLAALGAIALGITLIPVASAGCGDPGKARLLPQSWNRLQRSGPDLLLVSDHEDGVSMVGMWHVAFIAEGNVGPGLPPDGTKVDDALSQWHSDKTEVTLSSRVPATGDVCLGVWRKVGERTYRLNHFGISFDPSTDPNTPQGFANIRQHIFLSADGLTFHGRFSIRQYDSSGNLLIEIKGILHGTRVNLHTSVSDLLNQN